MLPPELVEGVPWLYPFLALSKPRNDGLFMKLGRTQVITKPGIKNMGFKMWEKNKTYSKAVKKIYLRPTIVTKRN